MSKFRFLLNSFRSGEFGPKLFGRTDTEQYREGSEEILNMVPAGPGGITRRPGSRYITSAITEPGIIPFIFSKTESFAILLSKYGKSPRVIDSSGNFVQTRISGRAIAGKTLDNWSDWASDLDINGWHHTQSGDIVVIVHNSGEVPPIVISRRENPNYAVPPDPDPIDAKVHSGIVFEFDWYCKPLQHREQDVRDALRWPFQPINIDEIWLSFSDAIDTIYQDITAFTSQAKTIAQRDFWDKAEIGSLIKIIPYDGTPSKPGNIEFLYEIVSLRSDTAPNTSYPEKSSIARVRIIHPSEPTGSMSDAKFVTKDWKKSYWSDLNGWPVSVTQFEQRLFFGGNKNFPDTLWGSKTGNIFHIMRERFEQDKNVTRLDDDVTGLDYYGTETASDPMVVVPATAEVNKIQWISGNNGLAVGTSGAEHVLTGGSDGLTQDNLAFRKLSTIGSINVMAAALNASTYHVARLGRKLRELLIDPVNLTANNANLNILNDTIIDHESSESETITKIISQISSNTIWALTSNNSLISFTSDVDTKTNAWHRHSLGGNLRAIKSIAAMPNDLGTYDDIWLSVDREGFGIQMLRTGPSIFPEGEDILDFGTNFIFKNFEPEGRVGGSAMNSSWGYTERRVAVRIPDSVDKTALDGNHFQIDDETLWNVWYNNGGAAPNTANTFEVEVDITTAITKQDIIDATVNALIVQYDNLIVDSNSVGVTSTGVDDSEHISLFGAGGSESSQARWNIRLFPATSTPASLAQDMLDNNEYILIRGFTTAEKSYRLFFGTDVGIETVTQAIQVNISAGDTQQEIMQELIDTIEAIEDNGKAVFTVTANKRFGAQNNYETLERIGEPFDSPQLLNPSNKDADTPYFLDSSIRSTTISAQNVASGFDDLEGETLQVLADGFFVGEKTVLNGEIALNNPAEEVIAGYGYTSRIKTLPIEIGSDFGTAVGVVQRIDKAIFIFYRTFGVKFGYDSDKLENLEFIPNDAILSDFENGPPLFSGRIGSEFPASPDDEQFVIIEQSEPYPVTVLAVSMRGVAQDRSE